MQRSGEVADEEEVVVEAASLDERALRRGNKRVHMRGQPPRQDFGEKLLKHDYHV